MRLPLADARALAGAARRTSGVRLALGAVLAGLLAAAVATSSGSAVPRPVATAGGTNTEIVLDVSGSISGLTLPPVGRALRSIARSAGRTGTVGLIVFSDSAVEALPPGTPVRELKPFVRFFTPIGSSRKAPPQVRARRRRRRKDTSRSRARGGRERPTRRPTVPPSGRSRS